MNSAKELLCPAGNHDAMVAAINNGADAIYLGGKSFNARGFADNFKDENLEEVIDYAHRRGVKVYITLNTLYKNNELQDVFEFAAKMAAFGADAFIMQDIGGACAIKKKYSDIPLHASTQMTAHSLEDVKLLSAHGFDRVVLSRELSLEEIKYITDQSTVDIEIFVHGALCVCYSGQCLMSSMIGGRSGNRGRCAQPCRLSYDLLKNGQKVKEGYLLSPKDMMALTYLDEINKFNIKSLKIEGRMKSPEYVGIVTKAYRTQLDQLKTGKTDISQEDIKNVTQIFNRGGSLSTGYAKTYSSPDMMSCETPKSTGSFVGRVVNYTKTGQGNQEKKGYCTILAEDALVPGDGIEIWTASRPHVGTNITKPVSRGERFKIAIDGDIRKGDKVYKSYDKSLGDLGKKLYLTDTRKLQISGSIQAKIHKPLKMRVYGNGIMVTSEGPMVEEAVNKPMEREKIVDQLSKTGGTTYQIRFDQIEIDDHIFISISEMNQLRRNCMDEFDRQLIGSYKRERRDEVYQIQYHQGVPEKKFSAKVHHLSQLEAAIQCNISRIYLDLGYYSIELLTDYANQCQEKGIEFFIALPRISRGNGEKQVQMIKSLGESPITGFLASTFAQIQWIKQFTHKKIVGDSSFNVYNNLSYDFFKAMDVAVTLSPELNFDELYGLGDKDSEIIAYGRQVLMVTNQCPAGLYESHKKAAPSCSLKGSGDQYELMDRKGELFPVLRDCNHCMAYILNAKTLYTANKYNDFLKTSCGYLRLIFWKESPEEVIEIINSYRKMNRGNESDFQEGKHLTYGHFYRGVE